MFISGGDLRISRSEVHPCRIAQAIQGPRFPRDIRVFQYDGYDFATGGRTPRSVVWSQPREDRSPVGATTAVSCPLKRGEAKAEAISTLVNMCFAAYGGPMGEFAHIPKEPSRLNTRVLQVATANSEQLPPGVQGMLRNYRKAHGLE